MKKKNNRGFGFKSSRIHNIHDKALFKALRNHEVAKDVIKAYLPNELQEHIDLSVIKQYKTKFVTPQFKQFEADILYQLGKKDKQALILLHCENQSQVDKRLPLRIWQYLLLVLLEYIENYPQEPLPVIFPLILYTGEGPYTESTNFFDLFKAYKSLAQKYMLNSIKLVDVCRMSDTDIKKHRYFGLSEFVFKHRNSEHFKRFLAEYLPWLSEVELQLGKDYAKMTLTYVMNQFKHASVEVLQAEMGNYLSEELGDEFMTIAKQLEKRGIQQGMQQGMKKGKQQGMQQQKYLIAKNMLSEGLESNVIVRITGLSPEDIIAIKEKMEK